MINQTKLAKNLDIKLIYYWKDLYPECYALTEDSMGMVMSLLEADSGLGDPFASTPMIRAWQICAQKLKFSVNLS